MLEELEKKDKFNANEVLLSKQHPTISQVKSYPWLEICWNTFGKDILVTE